MKKLYLISYFLLFFMIGELLIRTDIKYDILKSEPQKISIKIDETPIKKQVDEGIFKIDSLKFRVLVVGDSYIYGGGINPENKFSKVLIKKIKSKKKLEKEVQILDVSRPSNNTLDNYNILQHYFDIYKPDLIIWAYNFNDIIGGLNKKELVRPIEKNNFALKRNIPKQQKKKFTPLKEFTKKAYRSSKLLEFCSAKLQKELKLKGIVLPVGEFYFLIKKAYKSDSEIWIKSMSLIEEVETKCKKNRTAFILYRIPEFNLLKNEKLFNIIDDSFNDFSSSHQFINYINGFEDFENITPEEFMLSKYDGHPNEKAHEKIADRIYNEIKNEIIIK